jgi:GT2 family glycosyltransferase
LDSRNIIYNKTIIDLKRIKFDPAFRHGGEDSDFGMQIFKNGLKAIYDPNLVVSHKEPTSLRQYVGKKSRYDRTVRQLNAKWNTDADNRYRKHRVQYAGIFSNVTRKLSPLSKFTSACVILSDMIISKFHVYSSHANI